MADFGIYCKNADIQARAGTNANATAKAVAATDVYVLDVEAYINALTQTNWSDLVTAGLNADVEGILVEAAACWAAMIVIQWDLSSFPTLAEAQTMLNVLYDRHKAAVKALLDANVRKFIEDA